MFTQISPLLFFIKRNPHDGTTEGLIWWKGLWARRENSRTAQPEQACDITKPFPADPWPPGPLDRRGAQRRPILHSLAPAGHKPLTLYWQRVDTRLNLILELFHTALGKLLFFFCSSISNHQENFESRAVGVGDKFHFPACIFRNICNSSWASSCL